MNSFEIMHVRIPPLLLAQHAFCENLAGERDLGAIVRDDGTFGKFSMESVERELTRHVDRHPWVSTADGCTN